jgi:FAD synthase
VLKPETAPPLLQTFQQKMEGLENLGVGQVIVLEFTPSLASLSAEDFVRSYIVRGSTPSRSTWARALHLGMTARGA